MTLTIDATVHADNKVKKRLGAEGRWTVPNENGEWQPAKLARNKQWREV